MVPSGRSVLLACWSGCRPSALARFHPFNVLVRSGSLTVFVFSVLFSFALVLCLSAQHTKLHSGGTSTCLFSVVVVVVRSSFPVSVCWGEREGCPPFYSSERVKWGGIVSILWDNKIIIKTDGRFHNTTAGDSALSWLAAMQNMVCFDRLACRQH